MAKIVTAVGDARGFGAAQAILRTRTNLALSHLFAAARFSREVGAIRTANSGAGLGPYWDEMQEYAIASVVLAATCIECYANQLFSDREKLFSDHDAKVLDFFWASFERKHVFEKLDFALMLRSKPPLDKKARLHRSIDTLIELRNALVHFKPEWLGEEKRHLQISRKLDRQFASANIPKDPYNFPRGWVGHSCTVWAINSVIDFIKDFEAQAGLGELTDFTLCATKLKP